MIKQLKKVGNSQALILDRAILELAGLRKDGKVQIVVHDGSIVVTPVHPTPVDRRRFEACLDRIVKKRRDVLRRLAE